MVAIDQRTFDALASEESMRTGRFVDILERHHDDRPGVPRDAVEAYAREVNDEKRGKFDVEELLERVDDRLTASESWVSDSERLYELDGGRISQYPAAWYDRLRGETDPAAYLRLLRDNAPGLLTEDWGDRDGIKEDRLIDILAVVGGLDREEAKAAIESARDDGRLEEDADQHPKAGVYLAEG